MDAGSPPPADDFTSRMFSAINGMMLDVLAAVARKDYEDRRRKQAKVEGRYGGRTEDTKRNDSIAVMLKAGMPYSQIQNATGASRATIAKIAKRGGIVRNVCGQRPPVQPLHHSI